MNAFLERLGHSVLPILSWISLLLPTLTLGHDLQGLAATQYPAAPPIPKYVAASTGAAANKMLLSDKSAMLRLSKLRADRDTAIVIASGLGASPRTIEARGFTPQELSAIQSVVMRAKTWQPGKTIKVCFHEPTANRRRIADIASQWLQHGNLKIDFGAPPDLRTCSESGETSEIRITFRQRPPRWVGYASLIGTDSTIDKSDVSMILRDFDQADLNDPYFQSVVLHEFGHALGFHHEHQSPAADCERQFDIEKIKARTGWSDEQVKVNLRRLQVSSMSGVKEGFNQSMTTSGDPIAFSTYDRASIMHYSLPLDIFTPPVGDCYVPQNVTLSDLDKAGMSKAYPAVTYQTAAREHNSQIESLIRSGKLSTMEQAAFRALKRN